MISQTCILYLGRVGPGDSKWMHGLLFDNNGYMAYHSAVHDGFGYLITNHQIGPGYDYMKGDALDDTNCMAGQISGIQFWRKTLRGFKAQNTRARKGLHISVLRLLMFNKYTGAVVRFNKM